MTNTRTAPATADEPIEGSEPDSFGSVEEPILDVALEEIDAADGEAGLWSDAFALLRRSPTFISGSIGIVLFSTMAAFPGAFTYFYPSKGDTACDLSRSANVPGQGLPNAQHWFGFDIQGCDYYLRTIEGARTSITVGLLVTVMTVLIAVTFGTTAGYIGGWVDSLIARITDVWLAIPTILFATMFLSIVTDLPAWVPLVDETRGITEVALVMSLTAWPSMVRLMRASVMTNKESDFVLASRSLGASSWRIVIHHIIPNSIAPVIVYATIFMGIVITAEASLSFLGVGIQLPAVSWGLMISSASGRILTNAYLLLFPGICLFLTVLSFIVIGDAMRDALDPRSR